MQWLSLSACSRSKTAHSFVHVCPSEVFLVGAGVQSHPQGSCAACRRGTPRDSLSSRAEDGYSFVTVLVSLHPDCRDLSRSWLRADPNDVSQDQRIVIVSIVPPLSVLPWPFHAERKLYLTPASPRENLPVPGYQGIPGYHAYGMLRQTAVIMGRTMRLRAVGTQGRYGMTSDPFWSSNRQISVVCASA